MTDWTFRNLQDEQAPWVLHNFGRRPPWQPLLGIAEELGELLDAISDGGESNSTEEIKDSIADAIIFMADFCTSQSFDLETIYRNALKQHDALPSSFLSGRLMLTYYTPVVYGRLAHSFLKKTQGIRGIAVEHDRDAAKHLTDLLVCLCQIGIVYKLAPLPVITREVWERVRQRDWKKNATTGESP